MIKCIVVELDESNSLKHYTFDDKDEALAAIENTRFKCLLLTVEAPLQCWDGVKITVEDHT